MKRNKYKDYLWYVTLAVFVLCVIEGIMYYHDTGNAFLKFSLNIQNAVKAYKIDPDISQSNAISFLKESGGGIIRSIITYLYCTSVIIAPFCTVGALTMLLMKPANYVHGLLKRRNIHKILVLGEGATQTHFVDSLSADCHLTVIESSIISEEKKLKYLNHGIKFIQKYTDISLSTILKSLKLSHFESFLLCDDNITENIDNLKLIIDSCNESRSNNSLYQRIYICCNDSSMSEIIKQYYDKQNNKNIEINIIDINQMAVNKMLLEHPIYLANDKKHCDVHIGIIGFGQFGQSTLLQSLNMAVLSADSHICIDVFDKNISDIIGTFMKHFSVDILDGLRFVSEELFSGEQTNYYELCLPSSITGNSLGMDGNITLRFWQADTQTLQFNKIFKKCNEQMPFTYLVIAIGNTHSMVNTIITLKQLLYKKDASGTNIPIIIRTKSRKNMIEIYREDNLFEISQSKDIFSYDSLMNHRIVDKAKIFNHRYNILYDIINQYKQSDKILDDTFMLKIEQTLSEEQLLIEQGRTRLDETWHNMKIFERESSIAQAMHQTVKEWLIFQEKAYSLDTDKEELEKLEHRRWTIFMITQGFKYEKSNCKNMNAKTHPCILTWEQLKAERPDTLEYDFTPYYMLKNPAKK